uniref:Uncharacterized protein n=1 Tax=Anopheles dirus TaxID=7168 RepID=A0A182NY98_9DIPT
MPHQYDLANVNSDIELIRTVAEICDRMYPKYACLEKVDYLGNGRTTQLVCNKKENLRCTDLATSDSFATTNPLTGTVSEFWCTGMVNGPEFSLGMVHLQGEIPEYPIEPFHPREKPCARQTMYGDYASRFTNMFW